MKPYLITIKEVLFITDEPLDVFADNYIQVVVLKKKFFGNYYKQSSLKTSFDVWNQIIRIELVKDSLIAWLILVQWNAGRGTWESRFRISRWVIVNFLVQ